MGKALLNLVRNRERGRKFLALFTAASLVFQNGAVFFASPAFAATPITASDVNKLEQWETKPSGNWITGNLGTSNSDYKEGETVPFRLGLKTLPTAGNPYTFSICRDYENGSRRGYLFLLPFNTSRAATPGGAITSTNGPFSGVNVTINSFTEIGGQGACNAGERETQVSIDSTGGSTAYVLWGGHLASPIDPGVGAGNGAASYPGSSLHMKLLSPNKDVSINPGAIIELATITVQKVVDSGSATPDQWCFNISPNPNGEALPKCPAPGTDTVVFLSLPTGSYSITETTVAGYNFASGVGSSVNCTFSDSTATASVSAGIPATGATCVFHNELGEGDLTVRKNLDTNNDGHVDQTNVDTWTWDLDGGDQDYPTGATQSVLIGTHTISEDLQNGWHVVDLTCGRQSLGAVTSSEVNVPVQGLECIFTNARDTGTITVLKDIDWDESGTISDHPNDAAGVINWTWDIDGSGDYSTGSTQIVTTGSYTISEDQKPNYHVVNLTCGETNYGVTESQEIAVGYNEDVVCTFTNAPDTGSISGYKYEDADGDPNTTGDQSGKEGWEIKLFRCLFDHSQCDELVDQVLTDINGFFSFDNLVPGFYRVVEEIRAGWTNLTATFINVVLNPGEEDQNNNFINTELGTIIVEKQTVPDSAPGSFSFTGDVAGSISDGQQLTVPNLLPGTYTSTENDPTPEYDLTSIVCDDADSTGDLPTRKATFNLQPGETVTCVFTNTKRGSISGHKWNDLDGDGYWDGGEPTINGWMIFLDENDNKDLDAGEVSTSTAGGGVYSFSNLVPGDYDVCEVLEPGWTRTLPGVGLDCYYLTVLPGQNLTDYDFGNFENVSIRVCKYKDTAPYGQLSAQDQPLSGWLMTLKKDGQEYDSRNTGGSGCYTWSDLGPGSYSVEEEVKPGWTDTNGTTHDFGRVESGHGLYTHYFLNRGALKICGTKYDDLDGDGEFDGGEPGIEGWQISIYSAHMGADITSTDANGDYCFENLEPGDFTVTEEDRADWVHTSPSSVPVTLTDHDETVDFFNFKPGRITVCKYDDLNGNGVLDAGEPGIQGVAINISKNGSFVKLDDLTVTGEDGCLTFPGLSYGTYLITELVPEGYYPTFPLDPNSHQVSVESGTDVTVFFLNARYGSIGDFIWEDRDGDKIQDPAEPGIAGVEVKLYLDGGLLATTTTDSNGWYLFSNLKAGNYTVDVVDSTVPKDYKLTTANDPLSVQLDPGENELGADFGYKKKGEVLAATGVDLVHLALALIALVFGILLRAYSNRLNRRRLVRIY